ncbi:hypothetical protein RFI_16237 [Reticulomyxa filosa]|uniref:TRAF-type domain-containing protein n=1 Tax=Reticulomyxa filosa TaxID=46433 RepID=X6N4N3_RETFI|nr:hypothetical protein RFI_16237 [Reticulomyxa filosa]|eukprot:ETO20966.1 hypothetical protein RFI_16237 [Reticulomyxa filosa]
MLLLTFFNGYNFGMRPLETDSDCQMSRENVFDQTLQKCYSKEWVRSNRENEEKKAEANIKDWSCGMCGEIANNAMELLCTEHEHDQEAFIIGESCLMEYLKHNDNLCPISNHKECRFVKRKEVRKEVENLNVMCPRQYQLEITSPSQQQHITSGVQQRLCTYVGTIQSMKDHLSKSCPLVPLKCEYEEFGCNEPLFQHNYKAHKSARAEMHLQMVLSHLRKCQVTMKKMQVMNDEKFEALKKYIKSKEEETNALQLQSEDIKIEGVQLATKTCREMVKVLPHINSLKNGRDYLLVQENNQVIRLKNNELTCFKYGIYLLGENIKLTSDCDKDHGERGHIKIKTSHLLITHQSSSIDCSGLGYLPDSGPGKGGKGFRGGSAGHAAKGGERIGEKNGAGGDMYGEETLLKEIHFGSGGGTAYGRYSGGRGGGIIEITIDTQLESYGSIRCNGTEGTSEWKMNHGGRGSGGSILIKFTQSKNTLTQTFGRIECRGGGKKRVQRKGACGRIAIYGAEVSPDQILKIEPHPFVQSKEEYITNN